MFRNFRDLFMVLRNSGVSPVFFNFLTEMNLATKLWIVVISLLVRINRLPIKLR